MGILSRAVGTAPTTAKMGADFIGAPSFADWNPGYSFLNHFKSDAYASNYPSIRAIANEFMTIRPYAIDSKGKRKENESSVNALYHPNQQDSSVAFFEKLAVMNLTHRKTYILVWRKEGRESKPGGTITPNNIAGYTFLEYPSVTRRDGKTYYSLGANEFDEDEVMVIPGGVDPTNLYGGYSPSEASRRWATLDDYIADFQKGFFENGAVPAGQFVITAPTAKEFNDIVDTMQARHKGAGANGNVSYSHQPVDPATGKAAPAQVQWIPFAATNKEIDFKNLFEQVNKRLDTSFGVSQIVKGVDDAATYANAQVSEAGFAKRAVKPLALRIYTQITHELNRITNGLGVAITFDYEIPAVADEEKVRSETKNLNAQLITTMVTAGYSLESVVQAFDLPPEYKDLIVATKSTATDDEETDVDDGGEVNDAPDPDIIRNKTNAKNAQDVDKPKNELSDLEKLTVAARRYMQAQVDRAIEEFGEEQADNEVTGEPTNDERQTFVDEMLVVIVAIMIAQGEVEYGAGTALLVDAGIPTTNLNGYVLSESAKSGYQSYLAKVGQSYGKDTAESIRTVLSVADNQGFTRKQTENALKDIMNTDEWRIDRLTRTELNRSQSLSGVDAMKQIQSESGAILEKSLQHTGGDAPCEFCAVLIDNWVAVDQETIPMDTVLIGADGGLLVNKFAANDGYDPHPNGHCVPQFRVSGSNVATNELKTHLVNKLNLRCGECDRFLKIEPVSTTITKVTCSDRKCKHSNNVKVVFDDASEAQMRYKFDNSGKTAKTVDETDVLKDEIKLLKTKLESAEEYAGQLEGIVDGQG